MIVIYTGQEETLAALRTAGQLANNLHAAIQLLVPHVVPYPLDLHTPQVATDFVASKFRTLAGGRPTPTRVQVILCREPVNALSALNPHSLIVIGNHRRWWNRGESHLIKTLRRQGHDVIPVAA